LGIIWSKVSIRRDVLPINKKEHVAHLIAKQDISGKFVVVSWIAESIYQTINYERMVCPLTSLIITPLFLDTNPKQAAALIADRGDRPAWELITNAKRFNPAKAFQGKVWVPQKRNQILHNAFLTTLMACITPVILDAPEPTAGFSYYNSIHGYGKYARDLQKRMARDSPDRKRLQTQHWAMQKSHQTSQTLQTRAKDSKQEEERRRYPKRKGQRESNKL
jgi:hypothetical protein